MTAAREAHEQPAVGRDQRRPGAVAVCRRRAVQELCQFWRDSTTMVGHAMVARWILENGVDGHPPPGTEDWALRWVYRTQSSFFLGLVETATVTLRATGRDGRLHSVVSRKANRGRLVAGPRFTAPSCFNPEGRAEIERFGGDATRPARRGTEELRARAGGGRPGRLA